MIPQKPSRTSVSLDVLGVTSAEPVVVRVDGPALLMPIESAVARVDLGGVRSREVVDRSGLVVVPRRARVTVRAAAPAARVAMLTFHEPAFERMVRAHKALGVSRAKLDGWLAKASTLPRTVWIHEIVHRYVFERHALDQHDNAATRFLETEILKEVYFLFRDRDEGVDRATILHKHSAPVERAVAYLEAHLFERCSVAALARHAGASESTLLRAFHRELGCTPASYWRRRKHDEALQLLRTGRYSIAEVAERVGYENPTAFGYAFRLSFGRPPSAFRPTKPRRQAP